MRTKAKSRSRYLTEAESWDACADRFASTVHERGICNEVWTLYNRELLTWEIAEAMACRAAVAASIRTSRGNGWPDCTGGPDMGRAKYCRRQAARCRREGK